MPELLNSAKMAIEKGMSKDYDAVKQMFAFILPKLLDGVHKVTSSNHISFFYS